MLPKLYINGFFTLTGDAKTEDFAPFIDVRKLRRAEPVSKNALWCACQAVAQADIAPENRADMGISLALGAGALGSTLKFMDSIIEDGDELSSPTAFASSVHNSASLMLALFLNIKGPCVGTGQLDASFAGALLTAQQFLARKMCPQVLVVLSEDVNPLLAEVLAQNPHAFEPFMYHPQSPMQRVSGAFVVSAAPTEKTQFVLDSVALSRTPDTAAQSPQPLPVCSCAHSLLLLEKHLSQKCAFSMREVFAGTVLEIAGSPYVPA